MSIGGQGFIFICNEHDSQFVAFGPLVLKSTVLSLTEVIPIEKLHRILLVHRLHISRVEKYFHGDHRAVRISR